MQKPETYWEKRCLILENVLTEVVGILNTTQPPEVQYHIGNVGTKWDKELEYLDEESD